MSPSTESPGAAGSPPSDWRDHGFRYYAYSYWLRRKFGGRVQRVSLDGSFTCPNVDGTVAVGGCTFCDNRSFSPSRRGPRTSIANQLERGLQQISRRYKCQQVLAYFQPGSNTYAPVDRLRRLYEEALAHPQVVGLAVGTRSDCVPDEVLDLLEQLGRRTFVSVEYGMQTMHDRSLDAMNRGHHHDSFVSAVRRSRGRGLEICAQVILGLPGESKGEMLQTASELVRLRLDAVKIHNLYAVRNTPLGEQLGRGEVRLMEREAYLDILVDFLEILSPSTVVQRISGDAPPEYFLGPSWCLDKRAVRAALEAELQRRETWQGRRFTPDV